MFTTQRGKMHHKLANTFKGPYICTDLLPNDNLKLTPLNGIKPISAHKNNCKKGITRPDHLLLNDTSDKADNKNETDNDNEPIFNYSDELSHQPLDNLLLDDNEPVIIHQLNPGTEENDEPEPHPTNPTDDSQPESTQPSPDPIATGTRRKPGRPAGTSVSQSEKDTASNLFDTANLTKRPLTRSNKRAEELLIPLQPGTVPLEKQLNRAYDALKDVLKRKKRKEGKEMRDDTELDDSTDDDD